MDLLVILLMLLFLLMDPYSFGLLLHLNHHFLIQFRLVFLKYYLFHLFDFHLLFGLLNLFLVLILSFLLLLIGF